MRHRARKGTGPLKSRVPSPFLHLEVINTNTMARMAFKLMVLKVNIDKTGKVNSSFLGEKDPAYKALETGFNKK